MRFHNKKYNLIVLLLFFASFVCAQENIPAQMTVMIQSIQKMKGTAAEKKECMDMFSEMKNWRLLDRLERHSNECGINDKVKIFGFNTMARRITEKREGIINTGSLFNKIGGGSNAKYYLAEVTAKARSTISYTFSYKSGNHTFAIIPYNAKAATSGSFATIKVDGIDDCTYSVKDGVQYVVINDEVGLFEDIKLTIRNNSRGNMSFVIIDYNY